MNTPSEIVIEHKLDKESRTTKFFVHAYDYVFGGFITFDTIGALAAWIDKHDYRYVWGSRGRWRVA